MSAGEQAGELRVAGRTGAAQRDAARPRRRVKPSTARHQRGGIIMRLISFFAFLVFLWVIYMARHPILHALGELLIIDNPPQHSDAIIILSDDDEQADRARRAAQLYHSGWAPIVVASGRTLRPYISIADLMEHDLKDAGVPAQAMLKFPHHAVNTVDEARDLRGLCKERRWHRLIVVTSSFHTRRALYDFHRIFPANVEVRMVSAPDYRFDTNTWWEHYQGIKITCVQYGAVPVAMWTLRHDNGGEPW